MPTASRFRPNPVLANWHYLYEHPSRAEVTLEPYVAKLGQPYRFQHLVWKFIIDFAFLQQMVAVEIDGPDHDRPARKKADAERTAWLEKKGWHVVRFTNAQVFRDPDQVAESIQQVLRQRSN